MYLDFDFSRVQVFDEVGAAICRDVMQGYNGTIMAYGQTGAGKTFTLTNRVRELSLTR